MLVEVKVPQLPESVAEAVTSQENILRTRRQALQGQRAILEQRIAQINEEIVGLEGEIASDVRQLTLIEEELVGIRELVEWHAFSLDTPR